MKLHKLISRTVLATALLGTTIGGAFAGINASASSDGTPDKSDQTYKTFSGSNGGQGTDRSSSVDTGVKDGFLTLDSVPNLSFGGNTTYTTGQPDTLNLNNNNDST